MKVGLLDYGVGNLGSVGRALEELRMQPVLVTRALDMHGADCLVLPGVGSFGECMDMLRGGGWDAALREEVLGYDKPLLGICVGMQMLAEAGTEGAAEGEIPGLGLIPGRVEHLRRLGCSERLPHVGWNAVTKRQPAAHMFSGIPDGTDFYFVHSYMFQARDEQDVVATTEYGIAVTAAVARGRVWGTQFHPEKSSRSGIQVLRNFTQAPAC